jgi:hypothetical protein
VRVRYTVPVGGGRSPLSLDDANPTRFCSRSPVGRAVVGSSKVPARAKFRTLECLKRDKSAAKLQKIEIATRGITRSGMKLCVYSIYTANGQAVGATAIPPAIIC